MVIDALKVLVMQWSPLLVGGGFIWKLLDIYKGYIERRALHKEHSLDQLRWMQGLLESDGNTGKKFLTEQAFIARFGSKIDFHVVSYILACRKPTSALFLYIRGKRYLRLESENDAPQLSAPPLLFLDRKKWFIAGYYLFGLGWLLLLYRFDVVLLFAGERIWLALLFAASLPVFSYVSLLDYLRVRAAEQFLSEK